jgi:hypothetical protein
MLIFAIDPGTKKSAYVIYDDVTKTIIAKDILENNELLYVIRKSTFDELVIEMISNFGNVVGNTILDTCVWIGRFIEASPKKHNVVYRYQEKAYLCGNMRVGDADIRRALIVILGKEKTTGCVRDIWSALAVAVTYSGIKRALAGNIID